MPMPIPIGFVHPTVDEVPASSYLFLVALCPEPNFEEPAP